MFSWNILKLKKSNLDTLSHIGLTNSQDSLTASGGFDEDGESISTFSQQVTPQEQVMETNQDHSPLFLQAITHKEVKQSAPDTRVSPIQVV